MKELNIYTNTSEETRALGEKIGSHVLPNMVILMEGDLGAGKTTLTQGIARGLHIARNVTSPTFTILKVYHGDMPLYHIDGYRLEGISQDLGFEELLEDDGLTVIEWAQYLEDLVPEEYLRLDIHLLEEGRREFAFTAHGEKYEDLLEAIK